MKKLTLLMVVLFLASGCRQLDKLTGADHNAKSIDVPLASTLVRHLDTSGDITFTPSRIDGFPNTLRAFIKNADYNVATPGLWYEVDVKTLFDVSISTEYVVVNVAAQSAHVYNQPVAPPRSIVVESVPPGANDPGRPGA